jgi:hypothetical protein
MDDSHASTGAMLGILQVEAEKDGETHTNFIVAGGSREAVPRY